MAEFKNDRGDVVTAECGGIGGDNVLGTVQQKTNQGMIDVMDAKIVLTNISDNNTVYEDKSDRDGKFDIDVNCACEHRIHIVVTWTDEASRLHKVSGVVTCPDCPKDSKRKEPDAKARLKAIRRSEGNLLQQLNRHGANDQVLAVMQSELTHAILSDLNALIAAPDVETAKADLDLRMVDELNNLLAKLESARSLGPIPPQSLMWDMLQEILLLMTKLVIKVYFLQGRRMEPLPVPPKPGGVEA